MVSHVYLTPKPMPFSYHVASQYIYINDPLFLVLAPFLIFPKRFEQVVIYFQGF